MAQAAIQPDFEAAAPLSSVAAHSVENAVDLRWASAAAEIDNDADDALAALAYKPPRT
jgi:hypothetical protein